VTDRTGGGGAPGPGVSIVVPAYNAADYLERTLPALVETAGEAEIVLVDDHSADDTAAVAERAGIRVVRMDAHGGAAAARNRGAAATRGAVIVFVDADVLVAPGRVAALVAPVASGDADAVFGSYDDAPQAPGFFSQYANLRHHYYHQNGAGPVDTFWAGFGAVSRRAFDDTAGFDGGYAGVEDVAFGYRLSASGARIVMDPALQVTHLKLWTLASLVRTDIKYRARPWSRLLLGGRHLALLNIGHGERVRAVIAGVLAASVAMAPLPAVTWHAPAIMAAAAVAANWPIARFFARRRGLAFAALATVMHQAYYVYSGATFVACWLAGILGAVRRR